VTGIVLKDNDNSVENMSHMYNCKEVFFYFRRTRQITKGDYLFRQGCLFVSPSARNNSAPTGRMFVKLDSRVFLGNMSRKLKCH